MGEHFLCVALKSFWVLLFSAWIASPMDIAVLLHMWNSKQKHEEWGIFLLEYTYLLWAVKRSFPVPICLFFAMDLIKLKPIKTSNNRGWRSLLCGDVEKCNRDLLGREMASLPVAMAGLAGRRYRAASSWHLSVPSRWGHAVGEENLCQAAFVLAFNWLSGCHFAFFYTKNIF